MDTKLDRRAALLILASGVLTACGGGGDAIPIAPPPPPSSTVSAAVAVKWSNLATNAMLADTAAQPPGLSPMEQSRILAMAFLAGHDALNNISRVYWPFAVAAITPDIQAAPTYEIAVCNMLQALLPSHAAEFDRVLQTSLAAGSIYPYGGEIELGKFCAEAILGLRAGDGSANSQGPYTPGTAPGDYQPTPPVNVATFVNWGAVTPFAMNAGNQFRAPPVYAVTDAAYASDYDEVRMLGAAVGSTRTADQSEIAKFWLESTPLSWQRIAANLASVGTPSLWDVARTFALLQMAMADTYIASLDSKYYYNFWRPITAIHAADADGNPATVADPTWAPFDPVTPPVPEYPSAHAAAGAAGAVVLSDAFAGVSGLSYLSSTGTAARTFDDMWMYEIPSEIGLSRIYVGYHFRRAVDAGRTQGAGVGQWVLNQALTLAS